MADGGPVDGLAEHCPRSPALAAVVSSSGRDSVMLVHMPEGLRPYSPARSPASAYRRSSSVGPPAWCSLCPARSPSRTFTVRVTATTSVLSGKYPGRRPARAWPSTAVSMSIRSDQNSVGDAGSCSAARASVRWASSWPTRPALEGRPAPRCSASHTATAAAGPGTAPPRIPRPRPPNHARHPAHRSAALRRRVSHACD